MSEQDERREQLASSLMEFIWLCDEAEAVIADKDITYHEEVDLTMVVDTILPRPIDKDSIQGTNLKQLEAMVRQCTKCRLSEGRSHTVFGEGVVPARLMVIGEGPGAEEDASGRAFVGRAGKYLDSWLQSISMDRTTNVYIANIVKCRPPGNRNPHPDEVDACIGYLKRQIQLVKPEIILLMGAVAARSLLQTSDGVGKMRGKFHRYEGIPVLVTYHPAGVLRNPEYRRPVWEDLKKVAAYLNIPLPRRS
ncbi:MAG: uracil-DNA glycosylase [Sphaerochaeta sp.]